MRLIARSVLLAYARANPETAVSLERWCRLVKAANWTSMDDIRRVSPKAFATAPASKSLEETPAHRLIRLPGMRADKLDDYAGAPALRKCCVARCTVSYC